MKNLGNMRQGRIKITRYHPILHDAPPEETRDVVERLADLIVDFVSGWPHREEEETPIKKHPLHRR